MIYRNISLRERERSKRGAKDRVYYYVLIEAIIRKKIKSQNRDCRQYEDQIWDSAYSWISYNIRDLCGGRPCDQPPKIEVYLTKPICGEVRCEGNPRKIYYKARPGNCDRRCYSKYLLCYDYQTGQRDWDHQWSQIVGNGTCEPQPRKLCNADTIPWIIDCDLIINPIRCP